MFGSSSTNRCSHRAKNLRCRGALVGILVLLLSACRVEVVVDVEMAADGSGTVAVTVTADADVVNGAPGLAEDLRFDDAVAAGWTVDGPTSTDDGGLTVTLSHDFASAEEATLLLASVNGAAGPLQSVTITDSSSAGAAGSSSTDGSSGTGSDAGTRGRSGPATYTLSGALRLDGGLASFADPDVLALLGGATPYADDIAAAGLSPDDAVGVQLRVELPGDVALPEGSAGVGDDGATVWRAILDGSSVDVNASGRVESTSVEGRSSLWSAVSTVALAAMILWLVLAAAFIAFVVSKRRQRARRREAFLAARRPR